MSTACATAQAELTVNVSGCFATENVLSAFKEAAAKNGPLIRASAIVGLRGAQKHLLNIVNKFEGLGAKPFDTEDEARSGL
jgi:hypothetical protein